MNDNRDQKYGAFHRQLLTMLLLCSAWAVGGCAGSPPTQTNLMDELDIDATRRDSS